VGQLVRLANEETDLHRSGAEVVAVSVDPPGRNEALRDRWYIPFPIVSDPDGDLLLRRLDAWNPDERGGIAWPTVIVFDPTGTEVFRSRSRDFADRPPDDDLLDAVARLDLPPLTLGPGPPQADPIEDRAAYRTEAFGSFFRGIRSGVRGLSSRLESERDRAEAEGMVAMASSFLDAWRERRDSLS
jgi:hypothetical protein